MTNHTILSRRKGLMTVERNGSAVLMDSDTCKYYNLGEVGGRIWELLEEPTSFQVLVNKLTAEFDVSAERCRADIEPFLSALLERGLLEQR